MHRCLHRDWSCLETGLTVDLSFSFYTQPIDEVLKYQQLLVEAGNIRTEMSLPQMAFKSLKSEMNGRNLTNISLL